MQNALIASLLLATVPAMAQQAAPAATLVPGSDVKIDAVTSAKWVQGEPLKAFEPGKVYMFECWATWCGPCVAAIPHVNELHKKFHDKGLRVYGMNVWEDGLEKVQKFVKAKGDGMSYPVVYTGKGSAFETEWLKPAGVTGIPRALIVRDGKLVLSSHPSKITDSLIEALLVGGDVAKKAIDDTAARDEASKKVSPLMRSFYQASQQGDVAAMERVLAEIEAIDREWPHLPGMKVQVLVAKKDFAAAAAALEEIKGDDPRRMAAGTMANRIAMEQDPQAYPVDFVKSVIKLQAATPAPESPMSLVISSILQAKVGDKEASLKAAKSAVAAAAAAPSARKYPVPAFEKFAKAVEDGSQPPLAEFYQWISAAAKAAKEAEAKPVAK